MKLILTEEVKDLGKIGDVIDVANGYGRNYLLPRKLAVTATNSALKDLEEKKKAYEKKSARELEKTKELADIISKLAITLKVKVGEKGKLYGSITSKDIAEAMEQQSSISIDRRKIDLDEPIKSLGSHQVTLKLSKYVTSTILVKIEGEEGEVKE